MRMCSLLKNAERIAKWCGGKGPLGGTKRIDVCENRDTAWGKKW